MGKYTPKFPERVQRIIVRKIDCWSGGGFSIHGVTPHEVLWLVRNGAILKSAWGGELDYWKGLANDVGNHHCGRWIRTRMNFDVLPDSKLHWMMAERCFDFLKV